MSSDDDYGEPAHEEHEEEPWLVSYADLMTLLFGFFVLMYTFASAKVDNNSDNMVKMRKEVAKYFGGEYTTPYKKVVDKFVDDLNNKGFVNAVDVKATPEGMEVTIRSTTLFSSGSASLLPIAKEVIENLTEVLADKGGKFRIIVEGHTDDQPIKHSKIFPSNWELSGARASSVVRIFEGAGFDRKALLAIGFADTRPQLENRDENGTAIKENMAKNRRVVIKVFTVE